MLRDLLSLGSIVIIEHPAFAKLKKQTNQLTKITKIWSYWP